MTKSTVEIIPTGGALGADIAGFDIHAISEADFAVIRAAWMEHLVLRVRGQEFDDDAHLAFGRGLYQGALIRTHRDGLPKFLARRVDCGDAVHRKGRATLPESLGRPPFGSRMRPVGGRRNGLTMHRIAGAAPPTRRAAYAISWGHYQRSLV